MNYSEVESQDLINKYHQSYTNKLYIDNNKNNVNKQINANRIYNENDVKACSKCKQSKLLTEFNKNRTKSCGLRASCKSCQSIVSKHYNDNNKQINAIKVYNDNDVKICCKCKQQKLYTEFYKNVTKPLGLATYCKQCDLNDLNVYFRNQFRFALCKTIKSNNNNCFSFTGCDANFFKLWF